MVVATGRSQRQLAALADHVIEAVETLGATTVPSEGRELGDWVLIDAGDVIVHLFRPATRAHYKLEKMWGADLPDSDRVAV
jgi:ribosome-associated protein